MISRKKVLDILGRRIANLKEEKEKVNPVWNESRAREIEGRLFELMNLKEEINELDNG